MQGGCGVKVLEAKQKTKQKERVSKNFFERREEMSTRKLSSVLVVLLLLILATIPVSAKQITIKWWHYPLWTGITGQETKGMALDDPERAKYTTADWPKYAAKQFMELHPNVKVEVEILSWTDGRRKIDIAATAGVGRPDIFFEDAPVILKYVNRDMLEPVDPYMEPSVREDFYESALRTGMRNGKLWYWPWLAGTRFLLANKVIFDERGIANLLPVSGDRLWNFEQFIEAAKKTTYDRNGDGRIDVYGYAEGFAHQAAHFWLDPFIWGHGGRIFDETGEKLVLDSPETLEGLQFVADMALKHKIMPPGIAGYNTTQVNDLFNQGNLAMMIGTHGSKYSHELALSEGTIKPGTVELYPMMYPSAPGKQPAVFTVNMGFGIFKQKDPEKRKMVMEFAKFLTTGERARAVVAGGLLPLKKSIGNPFPGDSFMEYVLRTLDYGHPDTLSPWYDQLNIYLNSMYQAVVSGTLSPEAALKDAVKRSLDYMKLHR